MYRKEFVRCPIKKYYLTKEDEKYTLFRLNNGEPSSLVKKTRDFHEIVSYFQGKNGDSKKPLNFMEITCNSDQIDNKEEKDLRKITMAIKPVSIKKDISEIIRDYI